jgi:hypothetical protein
MTPNTTTPPTTRKRRLLAQQLLLSLILLSVGAFVLLPSAEYSVRKKVSSSNRSASGGHLLRVGHFASSSLDYDFEFDEEDGEDYWEEEEEEKRGEEEESDGGDVSSSSSSSSVAKKKTFYKKRMGKFRDDIESIFVLEEEEDNEDEDGSSSSSSSSTTFDDVETPLNARKCVRSIAMKPSRRLFNENKNNDNAFCFDRKSERAKHEDFPPVAVVAAIHARSLMKIKSKSPEAMTEFTENLRMAFGDERDKKSEMHSDGELVLVAYGVNEETESVLEDLEKHFFRENDFFLAVVDGDEKALNEISDYDDAIARGVKFTRAKFVVVADLNAIVPSAEWTSMALMKVFRTEPTISAVLFGGNENVSGFEGAKRPAMVVRAWEAKFALTSEDDRSSGCAKTEKSLVSYMVEKGMEFKRLPRKLKRIVASSRTGSDGYDTTNNNDNNMMISDNSDSSSSSSSSSSSGSSTFNRRLLLGETSTSERRDDEEEEELYIMDGKWEANANRGGVDGAFDLGCKSASKRNEKSLFCPSSSATNNNSNSNKRKRRVQATFIMQYFNRAKTLGEIFDALAKSVEHSSISSTSSFTMEVLANIDSGYKKSDKWVQRALEFKKQTGNHDSPFVLSFSNDIHELRAYNRLAHVATAELLVFAQDDDKPDVTDPSSLSWLLDGLSLMRRHKDLALLGAYRGRYDDGSRMKKSSNQNDGSKFGGNFESDRETRPIAYVDSELGVPFLWMYKVNMGPMLFKKSIFLASGGFHDQFSCAGEMAQGFDFEISVRMWAEGFKVGLYDPKWKHRIDKDLTQIGNQNRHRDVQKKELTDKKDEATRRNNQNIYTLFASNKNFHHEKGTKLAKKALKEDLAKKTLLCALPKSHELCASSFLDTPRDTVTCMSADRKCFQRKYIEKHNVAGASDEEARKSLPKDENGDIDVSKIRFTKGEKVRFKYEWLEHDGAQRVWNEALVETQKVALKTASRLQKRKKGNVPSSGENEDEGDEYLSVEDAIKQWLNENTPAINEKVEQVRSQLAKEAEPELKRAEELAARGLIYGTGGAVSEEERARRTKEAKFVDKKTRDRVVELAGIKAFEEGKEDRAAWEK